MITDRQAEAVPGGWTARALLERIGAAGKTAPAAETLRHATAWKQLVQDYRPVSESLEWQLGRLAWIQEGTRLFVTTNVPYVVTNDGRLSADVAAVLFANCEEAADSDGRPLAVLELGAGTGLFARYFLDEFRDLCRRGSRDFYDRLRYIVTDQSPRAVEQWAEAGIFEEHAGHVTPRPLDATAAAGVGPVRGVFCNYVLDVLPMAFVRKGPEGWQHLSVRTWITDDRAVLRQFTTLSLEEVRDRAASGDPDALETLLPVLPLLECEAEFLPAGQDPPPGLAGLEDGCGDEPFAYNYGAIACLESVVGALEPGGFVMISDYSPAQAQGRGEPTPGQRFGPTVAAGLNLPLIERHFRSRGLESWEPEGDAGRGLHTRLLSRGGLPRTRLAFESRFAAAALEPAEAQVQQARQQAGAGLWRQALANYRAAIECNPRNWPVIAEAAAFLSGPLRAPLAGLELARAAIALNPWYSPFLWNVLGDCLAATKRPEDAHECYLQAFQLQPEDGGTNLRLASSWLQLGDPARSLEAVARGLANDSDAMLRHELLDRQQRAIDALSVRWNAERSTASRRSGGLV